MPQAGDYLVTSGARGLGSSYLIVAVRPVRRRQPHPQERFLLTCQRISAEDRTAGKYWFMRWYSRRARSH